MLGVMRLLMYHVVEDYNRSQNMGGENGNPDKWQMKLIYHCHCSRSNFVGDLTSQRHV